MDNEKTTPAWIAEAQKWQEEHPKTRGVMILTIEDATTMRACTYGNGLLLATGVEVHLKDPDSSYGDIIKVAHATYAIPERSAILAVETLNYLKRSAEECEDPEEKRHITEIVKSLTDDV